MSQGTYTFLACFAGFWLIWALIVMLCCFCSFAQRKLKRRREERLREQCLRALEMEPLECTGGGYPPREPPQFCPPIQMMSPQLPVTHTLPQANWTVPEGRMFKQAQSSNAFLSAVRDMGTIKIKNYIRPTIFSDVVQKNIFNEPCPKDYMKSIFEVCDLGLLTKLTCNRI